MHQIALTSLSISISLHLLPPKITLIFSESDEEDEENVEIENIMDSSHNLDSHYSDTQSNSTNSTATALHLTPNTNSGNVGDGGGGGGGGGGGLAPPRNLANRRTSLADIISRVRRTSAGLQTNHPLQPLTESKSELPHYSIPGEKFADKRVKVGTAIPGFGSSSGGGRPPRIRRMRLTNEP